MGSDNELQGLQFVVESKAENSSKGIEQLIASFENLKKVLGGERAGMTAKMEKIAEAMTKMSTASESVTKTAEALGKLGTTKISPAMSKNLESVSKSLETFKADSASNIKVVSDALGELATNLERIKDLRGFDISRALNNTNFNPQASEAEDETWEAIDDVPEPAPVENSMGRIAKAASAASDKIRQLVGSLKRLGPAFSATKDFGREFLSIMKEFGQTMGSRIASSIKNVTGRLGQMFSSIKRIAMYRLIRALFSSLTGGVREGIKNIYEYSRLVNGTFRPSMDGLASSFQYLKNSMGSVAAPLLSLLAPAIDYIIDKVVTLLNLLAQLFARLSGATHYTAAKKAAATYGAAAGQASAAAKELKKTIMSFDEIHKLDDPRGGSGGGGGGGGTDYGSMFEELPIDSAISEFADRIRAAFESKDWFLLGEILGDKFNEIVDSVPWGRIGDKIGGFFTGCVETGLSFLRTADFFNLGRGFGETVVHFFDSADFTSLGGLLVRKITTGFDVLFGFLTTGGLGKAFSSKLSDMVIGAMNEFRMWIADRDWNTISAELGKQLMEVIRNIKYAEIAREMWRLLKEAFSKPITPNLIAGAVTDALTDQETGMAKIPNWLKAVVGRGTPLSGKNQKMTIGADVQINKQGALNLDKIFALLPGGKSSDKKVSISTTLKKGSVFDSESVTAISSGGKTLGTTIKAVLTKGSWNGEAGNAIKLKSETITRAIKQSVEKGTWNGDAWSASGKLGGTTSRVLSQTVKAGTWSSDAWNATKTGAASISRYLTQAVSKGTWSSEAWDAARSVGGTVKKSLQITVSWIGNSLKEAWKVITGRANGGVLSVNGTWGNIPQYAGGTAKAHGSLFIAGEQGAEVVGHLNGHTEVLNRSQMAATMFSAMVAGMKVFSHSWETINRTLIMVANQNISAMYDVAAQMAGTYEAITANHKDDTYTSNGFGEFDIDALVMGVSEGVSDANLRQNELLREQNQLLRDLLDKEVVAEFTTSAFSKAINRKNVRDGKVSTPVAI